MNANDSKFKALQRALESYFRRFPRVTIKALSAYTSVPYATMWRIMNSEVNEIKDETVFRIIYRVMTRQEQVDFIRTYYPILESMHPAHPLIKPSSSDLAQAFKAFIRMSPHNLVVKLALVKACTARRDVERLTGEYGLAALDEMIDAGLVVEENGDIFIHPELESLTDVDDVCQQIMKDMECIPANPESDSTIVRHVFGSVSAQGLSQITEMGQNLLSEVEEVVREEKGRIPFFFDLLSGSYDSKFSRHLM